MRAGFDLLKTGISRVNSFGLQQIYAFFCLLVALTAEEFCLLENFVASCNESSVILINSARYGRMYQGKCLSDVSGDDSIGCFGDVTLALHRICSGKSQCSVAVQTFEEMVLDCYKGDRLRFLDVQSSCIQLKDQNSCANSSGLSSDTGYLEGLWGPSANISNRPGSEACNWRLRTEAGRTFELHLIDITLQRTLNDVTASAENCPARLIVASDGVGRVCNSQRCSVDLCGEGLLTRQPIYQSKSHDLHVYIELDAAATEASVEARYLISYTAVGCADIVAPLGTWSRREDDVATVYCNTTGETWYLVCRDTSWIGGLGNCSETTPTPPPTTDENGGFQYGILIAVIIGIGIGTVVGLILLAIVINCLKCYKKKKASASPDRNNSMVPFVRSQSKMSTISANISYNADPTLTIPRNILHNQKLVAQERGSPTSSTPQYQLYESRRNTSLPSLPAQSISSVHSYEEVDPIYETAFPQQSIPPQQTNTLGRVATISRRPSIINYHRQWSDDSEISQAQTGSYLVRSSTFKY